MRQFHKCIARVVRGGLAVERLSVPSQLDIRSFEAAFSGQAQFQQGKRMRPVIGELVAGLNSDMRRRAGFKMYVDVLFVDDVSGTEG